jgi:hypothetical protein
VEIKLLIFGGAFFILLAERVGMPKEWWRMVPCSTHLSVSKKSISPYKMPNFIYKVLCQKKRYFHERMSVVLIIAWNLIL